MSCLLASAPYERKLTFRSRLRRQDPDGRPRLYQEQDAERDHDQGVRCARSRQHLRRASSSSPCLCSRSRFVQDHTHTIEYYNPVYDLKEDHGTTHLSVIDKFGSAVSLTSTVNLIFGSRVMDEETGIILNDEMVRLVFLRRELCLSRSQDDFATPNIPDAFGLRRTFPPSRLNFPELTRFSASPYNFPAPGKRPLSSTAPIIMDSLDGEVLLAAGGSGGSRIFGAVAQVLLNLDWGYDVGNAVEQPRVHDQLSPAYVSPSPFLR